jgi:HEPN domain-containing protein
MYLAKAEQNIDAANLLHDKKMFGLAGYHARQFMELSIKACIYKFGLEDYLRLL